jgi:FixJ family two-component response regulator
VAFSSQVASFNLIAGCPYGCDTPEATLSSEPLISIIDDDRRFRESLRRLLRSSGYAAEAFPSAVEFLASAGIDVTDCVIADINMPTITGIELYQRLMESGRAIPTILITAYPDEAVRSRALNDGVVCYLQKPFDEDDLMRCLRLALERKPAP